MLVPEQAFSLAVGGQGRASLAEPLLTWVCGTTRSSSVPTPPLLSSLCRLEVKQHGASGQIVPAPNQGRDHPCNL